MIPLRQTECIALSYRQVNKIHASDTIMLGENYTIILQIFIRNNVKKNDRVVSLYTPKVKIDLNGIVKKIKWL